MAPHCLGKPGDPGRRGRGNRLFVEAVPWIARTGSPWRDLPAVFGHRSSVFTRFRDRAKADVSKRLLDATPDDPDMEHAMADATIVKAHRLVRFALPPGQRLDAVGVSPLSKGSPSMR